MDVNLNLHEDEAIYQEVIQNGLLKAKTSVWIATANIKDIQIQVGNTFQSIVKTLAALSSRGVELRILHSGVPTDNVIASLKKYGFKFNQDFFTMKRCPRVHFKTVIIDHKKIYIGSANLTGAGIGAKSETRRNFELGLTTESKPFIDKISTYFNVVWSGSQCQDCGRKKYCPVPLEEWVFD